MQMVHAVRGEAVWKLLSLAAVAALAVLGVRALLGEDRLRGERILAWLEARPWLPEAALAAFLVGETAWLAFRSSA
jgi:hypothetical protein